MASTVNVPQTNPPASLRRGYWDLVAEKIARDPDGVRRALATVERWLADGHSAPHRLAEWRTLLEQAGTTPTGLARLLEVLRGTSESSRRLKDFGPFAGVLTREERRQARELCGFRY